MKKHLVFIYVAALFLFFPAASYAVDIDGEWICDVGGRQVMMTIDGTEYQIELNDGVTERGTCEIAGDTMRGTAVRHPGSTITFTP